MTNDRDARPGAASARRAGARARRPVALSLARLRAALADEGVTLGSTQALTVLSKAAGHFNVHETQALVAGGALAPRRAESLGTVTAPDGTTLALGRDPSRAGGGLFAVPVAYAAAETHFPSPYGGLLDGTALVAAAADAGGRTPDASGDEDGPDDFPPNSIGRIADDHGGLPVGPSNPADDDLVEVLEACRPFAAEEGRSRREGRVPDAGRVSHGEWRALAGIDVDRVRRDAAPTTEAVGRLLDAALALAREGAPPRRGTAASRPAWWRVEDAVFEVDVERKRACGIPREVAGGDAALRAACAPFLDALEGARKGKHVVVPTSVRVAHWCGLRDAVRSSGRGASSDQEAYELLRAATRLSDSVYVDNGDVTLETGSLGHDDWVELERAASAFDGRDVGRLRASGRAGPRTDGTRRA